MLLVVMCMTMMPLSANALADQEQEDIYRVNELWQDEYNQQYIECC
jgi:hypothetical protein